MLLFNLMSPRFYFELVETALLKHFFKNYNKLNVIASCIKGENK